HHVALRVPDPEAAEAALRAAGVPLRKFGPNLGFEDPEGTVFHFVSARVAQAAMKTQAEKAADFAALHAAPGAFVAPNRCDAGSPRTRAGAGYEALPTTGSASARSTGAPDHRAGRENALAPNRAMAAAVALPISGDLENGFGHDPETVAETIRLGAAAG